jgi:sulfonate transport system permease protein
MSFDERGVASLPAAARSESEERAAAPRRAASLLGWADTFGFSAAGSAVDDGLSGRPRVSTVLLGLLLPGILVAVWWSVTTFTDISAVILPSPEQVVLAGVELAENGLLSTYILISLQRVLLGFAIGASVGLALGALVGLSRVASQLLSPMLGALRAVPSLAWVPLLIIYLGIFEESKVTLIAIGAAFPVFTTVAGALRHVDPHLVEAGRAFGLGPGRLLTIVQLPAVVPSIVSGLRLALAQAWLFLVAAELIASSMGLGFLLTDSQYNGRVDRIFLAIILLAVLGKTSDALIGIGERALLKRWG